MGDVADGEDDQAGDAILTQPGDVAILLRQALLGIGEADLVAARLDGVLDADQNIEVERPVHIVQHQPDAALGGLRRGLGARISGSWRTKVPRPCTRSIEPFVDEGVQGLADGAPTDLVLLCDLKLSRQLCARGQATIQDALAKIADQVSIQGHF